jgi:hypothetical protein
MSTSQSGWLIRAMALVAICATLAMRANTPPEPRAATAPLTEFSAIRAMRHVHAIAQHPHPIGSIEAARVRAYLDSSLATLGVTADSQVTTAVGTRYQVLGHVHNIIARMRGSAPGGRAILLMSHYDGVPAGPAASDAGSGVAVILELVRALRAGAPLSHDVIVLLTDGEEAGLLGASAFVREHPWAKDVDVTLNFEARGTGGRASMFETGPGNLDLVRVLRTAPDVSASSLSVTLYRTLNNDTDLSEVALLGKPALNYAFVNGVERYHTTQDDPAHLDPGSMQQEGAQALTVLRALGDGPLPRPITGDAIFSDLPLLGVIYYPESVARPLLIVIVLLFGAAVWRVRTREPRLLRDLVLGVLMTVVAVALAGGAAFGCGSMLAAWHDRVGGNAAFNATYGIAVALLALAITLACWALCRRWSSAAGAHLGALLVWLALGALLSLKAPGASFTFVWPLPLMLIAVMLRSSDAAWVEGFEWLAALVALAVVVPLIALVGPVLIGLVGAGGVATGVLVALLALLLAPLSERIAAERRGRLASIVATVCAAVFVAGVTTVRATVEHPTSSVLIYATDADSTTAGAWLLTPAPWARPQSWVVGALGTRMSIRHPGDTSGSAALPAWLADEDRGGRGLAARDVPRVAVAGPSATLLHDSTVAAGRLLVFRVVSPSHALSTSVSAGVTRVIAASVDGRAIDTTRFRRAQSRWSFSFAAPPDSGFVLAVTVPRGTQAPVFDVVTELAGLPEMPGVTVPPRPENTIPVQMGDVAFVRRRVAF